MSLTIQPKRRPLKVVARREPDKRTKGIRMAPSPASRNRYGPDRPGQMIQQDEQS